MVKGKIYVAGIGPGCETDITPAVMKTLRKCDVVVGYKYYFRYIESFLKDGTECVDTGMKREKDRARQAFELAEQVDMFTVVLIDNSQSYNWNGCTRRPCLLSARSRPIVNVVLPLPDVAAPMSNCIIYSLYLPAITSISTSAPLGRAATWKQTRAGLSCVKNSA